MCSSRLAPGRRTAQVRDEEEEHGREQLHPAETARELPVHVDDTHHDQGLAGTRVELHLRSALEQDQGLAHGLEQVVGGQQEKGRERHQRHGGDFGRMDPVNGRSARARTRCDAALTCLRPSLAGCGDAVLMQSPPTTVRATPRSRARGMPEDEEGKTASPNSEPGALPATDREFATCSRRRCNREARQALRRAQQDQKRE